jgi:hypothetical protein
LVTKQAGYTSIVLGVGYRCANSARWSNRSLVSWSGRSKALTEE